MKVELQTRQSRLIAAALAVCCFFAGCSQKQGEIVPPQGGIDESGAYRPQVPDVSAQLSEAEKENSDVVGWLMLPNTTVDEAVVQTTDNEYYMRKDVRKNYAYEGCYYMDYESVMFDDGKDPSQNTIIYGHNLGSPKGVRDDPEDVKFAQLLKLNDEAVAKKTPYVYLVTKGETHIFEIFAAYYCEAHLNPVPYHLVDYTAEDLLALTSDAKARSQFLYDVEVRADDKLLTLSTCTYKYGTYSQNRDQRYVVMARLMKPGDKFHEEASIKANPSPKEPDFSKK